eukprot:scaffold1505_cov118-Cylindrotheca_fusiformis.AAC.6
MYECGKIFHRLYLYVRVGARFIGLRNVPEPCSVSPPSKPERAMTTGYTDVTRKGEEWHQKAYSGVFARTTSEFVPIT